MCTVERFFIIHPNGFRERGSRLRPCERGTQNIPCNNPIIIETSPEVPGPNLSPSTPPPRQLSPDIHVIEPRQRDRRGRPESTKRPRGFADNLRLLFNAPNLFTSRKKKTSKPKPPRRQFVLVRPGRGRQHHPQPEPARYHQPTPPPPPTHNIAPQNRPPVVQVPVHHREPEDMHPRRGQRVPIRDLEYQDEQDSPPPIAPYRQHHRPRARTLSPTSRYEERKRAHREAERVEHEQRQRERWRLDQDAERQRRYQAQRDAERQRRYQAQRDAEQEGRRVQREAERDRRRWDDAPRREAEEIERRRQERARRASAELASRRRDQARREAAEQERRRQARARREAEEQERRRQDRARRDEQERNERRRAARIPRGPRHPPAVHQYTRGRGSLDDRGDQVLNEAIQARTEAERNDPYRGWYRWPDTGGLRRRDTVAGGQRWVTEHDRRRGGRRHWI